MRILLLILAIAVSTTLAYLLDSRSLLPVPLGRLLSPQEGLWQNAEPVSAAPNAALSFPA